MTGWDRWYPRILRAGQDGTALAVGAFMLTREDPSVWQLMIGAVCIGAIAASMFEKLLGLIGSGRPK